MSLVVIGTVALDSVKTPAGAREEALGGSATYFAVAASFFTPVRMLAVVGEDFPEEHLDRLSRRQIDTSGILRIAGETFRWSGEYGQELNEARRIATRFITQGLQTIVFARSRMRVEVLTTYLRRAMKRIRRNPQLIEAYRGGILPHERRRIERSVREGKTLGVVSTNALELGIDVGQLRVAVLAGYPGTIASTWQQGGRAGRTRESAATVLVASSAPLEPDPRRDPVDVREVLEPSVDLDRDRDLALAVALDDLEERVVPLLDRAGDLGRAGVHQRGVEGGFDPNGGDDAVGVDPTTTAADEDRGERGGEDEEEGDSA